MQVVDVFEAASPLACLCNFARGYGFWAADDRRTPSGSPPPRLWWQTAEHFLQAGKFADEALREQVRRAEEPGIAKGLGRSLAPLREDWDAVKRGRLRRAMLEKLWTHREPREALLSIPAGARIVNGNPADPYFGVGRDGSGANVIGLVLEELRAFFRQFPRRRQLTLKVAQVGEPFAPRRCFVDVAGVAPAALPALAAEALNVPEAAVQSAAFLTEGGFERTEAETFADVSALEAFLEGSDGDCELEAELVEVALASLWNGTDDCHLAQTDLRHLCPDVPSLRQRLRDLMPLLGHPAFVPSAGAISVIVNGEDPEPLADTASARVAELAAAAADEGADVLISATYELPAALQPSLLPVPEQAASEPGRVEVGVHTSLEREALVDRIKGLVWGAALGDAVGLATEFMKPAQAAEEYPDPSKLGPNLRVMDQHRSRWAAGDWTDDTDQLVLVMDAVVAGNGVFDQRVFAQALKRWRQQGFPELGDSAGLGIGQTVDAVLEHQAYDLAPDVAAQDVWLQSGGTAAANGAVMRCAAAALGRFWDEEAVAYNAAASAAVTHADPRCITSSVAVAHLAARCLLGVGMADSEERRGEVLTAAFAVLRHLDGGDADELERFMDVPADGLAGLGLGRDGIGYTMKPLGAACWAFLHAENFRDAIVAITMEAGDADSNATVAGALLGARFGFPALPADWLAALPELQRGWLEERVAACLRALGL